MNVQKVQDFQTPVSCLRFAKPLIQALHKAVLPNDPSTHPSPTQQMLLSLKISMTTPKRHTHTRLFSVQHQTRSNQEPTTID